MPDNDLQIIWENRLDGRFLVKVERIDSDTGRLTIADSIDSASGGLGLLADDVVPLLFGAAYGPGGQDVARWMDRTVEIVDSAISPKSPADPRET